MLRRLSLLAITSSLVWGHAAWGQTASGPRWEPLLQQLSNAKAKGHWQEVSRLETESWSAISAAGPATQDYARAVQQVASSYQQAGYERKAEAIYQAALSAAGKQDSVRAELLGGLALLYRQEQKQLKAISAYRQAIKAEEAIAGSESASLQSSTLQLAQLTEEAGHLTEAEELFRHSDTLTKPSRVQPTPYYEGQIVMMSGLQRAPGMGSNLAQFYARHQRLAEAEQIYRQALESAEQAEPKNFGTVQNAGRAYVMFLSQQKRFSEAIEIQSRLVRLQETSPNPSDRAMAESAKAGLANTYLSAGQYDKANEIFQARIESAANEQPAQRREAIRQYAQALVSEKQFGGAEKLLQQILSETASGGETAQWETINARYQLAQIRELQGDKAAAEQLREQLRQEQKQSQQESPQAVELEAANRAVADGKWEFAAQHAEQAIAAAEAIGGQVACFQAQNIGNLLAPLATGKKLNQAEILAGRILSLCENAFGPDSPVGVQTGSNALLYVYQTAQRWKEWEQLQGRVLEVVTAAKGADSPALVPLLQQSMETYRLQNNQPAAEHAIANALRIQEAAMGADHPQLIWLLQESAQLQIANGNWPNAERFWKRALAISENGRGRTNPQHIWLLATVAQAFNAEREHHGEAVAMVTQALEFAKQSPDPESLVKEIQEQRQAILGAWPEQAQTPSANSRWFQKSGGVTPAINPQ